MGLFRIGGLHRDSEFVDSAVAVSRLRRLFAEWHRIGAQSATLVLVKSELGTLVTGRSPLFIYETVMVLAHELETEEIRRLGVICLITASAEELTP